MDDRNLDRFFSWGRYLHWSNIHFRQYQEWQEEAGMKDDPIREMRLFAIASQWLASLYVVIEGWKKLSEKDNNVEELLNKYPEYIDLLRKYRNAVYHYQPTLFDERFAKFTNERGALIWATAIELEFQRFFWEWSEKFIGTTEEIDEIRGNLEKIVGWIPSNIIAVKKHHLEKLKTQALNLLSSSNDKQSAVAKDLRDAINMVEKVIKQTPISPMKDLLKEKK